MTAIRDPVEPDCTDLDEARQGRSAAFSRLYERHAAVVLSLCRQSIPGRSLADGEDALQETFIRAFAKLDQVQDCRGFRSWLYQIARLVCSERRRSAARRHKHEEHAMRLMMERDPAAESSAAAPAEVDKRERLERLGAALDRLPDDERLAVHLYYLDPDPVAAARGALGVSRSGFYKLLTRARESLARSLKEAAIS